MGKLFDLHIEIGTEQSFYYSRAEIGGLLFGGINTSPSDAAMKCVQELHTYGIFTSLKKNPSYAQWPLSPTTNNRKQPIFTLHFEYGDAKSTIQHYWKTVLKPLIPNSGHRYYERRDGKTYINILLCELIKDIETSGIISELLSNPSASIYPFPPHTPTPSMGGGSTSSTPVAKAVLVDELDKEIVRKLPSHIIDISHPHCQMHCTSWEHFGKSKCKNMCKWRPEV
jgi:hypothetical protein